ncbi:MAG TPA: RidA family protein [Candidatus Paceibacterota bacterium]|nr:RidA family protein [Candidatus Paceibacterota bacterium]
MKKAYGSSEFSTAPLSSAQEIEGLIFVSGQIHADKNLNLIGETIEERFTAVMANIERILVEAQLTNTDIIQARLYLTNLDELPALNEIYKQYFKHPLPARTAIGVSKLPLGASLEIEVIAAR